MADIEKTGPVGNEDISADVKDPRESAAAIYVEGDAAPHGIRAFYIDEGLQQRVVRKLDWNIMPIVTGLCMLCSRSKFLHPPLRYPFCRPCVSNVQHRSLFNLGSWEYWQCTNRRYEREPENERRPVSMAFDDLLYSLRPL